MTIEAISAAMPAATSATGASSATPVGYGASLTDVANFEQAMARVEAQPAPAQSDSLRQVFKPLESVNNEAAELSEIARAAQSGDKAMTPGEVVALTVRSTEFMFHCQLTSNIANRTSDGLQQLFRQQS